MHPARNDAMRHVEPGNIRRTKLVYKEQVDLQAIDLISVETEASLS
jgi:hypothetical protein